MTGRRAALALVERAVERFLAATEWDRLLLYRMHLQATVHSVSPFTLAFAEHVGVGLDDAMGSIRPPIGWPWRPARLTVAKSLAHTGRLATYYAAGHRRPGHELLQRYSANHGFVHFGEGSDMLLFDIDGAWLTMQGRVGECTLRVAKGMAYLTLPAGVPETLVGAMVGREVEAIVEHPALIGRGYVVRRVIDARRDMGPTILFPTGRTRLAMPWPGLLDGLGTEVSGHARPPVRIGEPTAVPVWTSVEQVARTYAGAGARGA